MRISRAMEIYRRAHPVTGQRGDATCGIFVIPARRMTILASAGMGWDHVSVSLPDRCPTWDEMQWVREQFFGPNETVIQIHPPLDQHINVHPYCLHLWRPHDFELPLPSLGMIG